MKTKHQSEHHSETSRRAFMKGMAAGGVMTGLGLWQTPLWAQTASRQRTREISGTSFDLRVGETPVDLTGRHRTAITVNDSMPAPTLRWRQGDRVTLRVSNELASDDTSIHWHGILLPANMDGVPGFSFRGIRPGETFTYAFDVKQAGTYWYHSHSGFQEQQGLYGAIVIDPAEPAPFSFDREHVVVLSDWTDEHPARVFAKLKKQSHYYNQNRRTLGDFFRDVRQQGLDDTLADRGMWGQMRMSPTDLADVTGATYTYLMNGAAPTGNWTGLFRPGEKVLLRFINGSAMSYFDIRIPGLKMTVVAADGQYVHPISIDEFRIAVAETFDVIVEPTGQEAFTIFAQSIDRSGYASGTLAVEQGLRAPVPDLDAPQLLTMTDMAMSHEGMGNDMADHDMAAMGAPAAVDDPHAGHNMPGMPAPPPAQPAAGVQTHPKTELGNPLVDGLAMSPTARLDDPGVGLRDNGRHVLTYADLRSLFDDPDGRDPDRTIEIHLTGHMEKFAWSFNGIPFGDAEPLELKYGERVRVVLVNDTMMSHPIHLHGLWSDVENDAGEFHLRKHTVDMPPGTKRSYRVRADALGRWAYHCHLLMHMESGMMREVKVVE